MHCSFYFLLFSFYIVNSLDVKIFLLNTNYNNLNNWKEHKIPCEQSHVIFPIKTPKIFFNGSSTVYHISEMILPLNGELIFDDRAIIIPADLHHETDCDIIMSHYKKVDPDFWYDPKNWCQTTSLDSTCENKPRVEASLVPSTTDTAVFRKGNSFYVATKSTEPKIFVKAILLRENMFRKTFLFRQKIRKTLKSNAVEFVNVDNNYPPIIEFKGSKCADNSCYVNSNLKRMETICSYVVKCRPITCAKPVKPSGGCCPLCGQRFTVQLQSFSSRKGFEKWFTEHMEIFYGKKLIFNLLAVERSKLEAFISMANIDVDLADVLASEIVDRILFEKHLIGVERVESMSWPMASKIPKTFGSALLIIAMVVLSVLLVAVLFLFRRKLPRIPWAGDHLTHYIPKMPTIKWPSIDFSFFRDTFARSRLDEDGDNTTTMPGSLYPSMTGAVEAIELPEKIADVSFDNPIYDSEMNYEDSVQ